MKNIVNNKKNILLIAGSLFAFIIFSFLFAKMLHGIWIRPDSNRLHHECCMKGAVHKNGGFDNLNKDIALDSYDNVTTSIEYGAGLASKDTSLTLEEMLTYAIQDEYLARMEYETIIAKYGTVRPFSNIIHAEVNHIAELKKLFETKNIAIPKDLAKNYVVVPGSLQDAYKAGVDAEVLNSRMYDQFLNEALDAEVRTVFEALKNASLNHLRAFERKA